MKLSRVVLALGGVVLVVFLAFAFFVGSSLDSIVEDAIEHYGSQILGAAVRVSSVRLSLGEGRGTIRGIRVRNPDGFSSDEAFEFREIALQIDVGSLTGNPLIIKQVSISEPVVRYEVNEERRSNIKAIQANIEAYQGGSKPPSTAESADDRLFSVREFTAEGGVIEFDGTAAGATEVTLDLPPLRLNNLGGTKGDPPDEIGQTVMRALTQTVVKAVAKSVALKGATDLIEKKVGGEIGGGAKGILDKILE